MSDSPPDSNWRGRYLWWIGGALTLLTTLLVTLFTQFHHIEPNAKRMAVLMSEYFKPAPPPAPAPAPPAAEPPKKVEPPRPTVTCLKSGDEMKRQLAALGGEKWEPAFNAHFKNRSTCMVLALTEVADAKLTFFVDDEVKWTYLVTPRNRPDLKRFNRPGVWLLIEGDLERYADSGPDVPDEIYISRARITEAKEPAGLTTGSIKK